MGPFPSWYPKLYLASSWVSSLLLAAGSTDFAEFVEEASEPYLRVQVFSVEALVFFQTLEDSS